MKNLRERVEKVILKNHTYLHYGMLMHASEVEAARRITEEIIQALKDEVLRMVPEKHQLNTEFDTEHKETIRIQGRLEGYNQAIDELKERLEGL